MFNVYLATPAPFGASVGFSAPPGVSIDYPTIRSTLEQWFEPITQAAGFGDVQVQYTSNPPTQIYDYELLIYLVWSPDQSVIKMQMDARGIQDSIPAEWIGRTFAFDNGIASEVYLVRQNGQPVSIAATVFHEAMHNKLPPNFPLHTYPGVLLGQTGGVALFSGPSDIDTMLMYQSLGNSPGQWLDGFALYQQAGSSDQPPGAFQSQSGYY